MILPIHVLIALLSVGYTTYVFFSPSIAKLRVSYSLVVLTIASGTYLVWSNPAHMVQACTTGLFYVGITTTVIVFARSKLAKQSAKIEHKN